MDSKLREWQLDIERIRSAAAPDWREAARLADVMARISGEVILRQAAAQALPILRRAALEAADPGIADAAQRRLGIISEVLHTLTTPKFGRRDIPLRQLTPEERHRQLLGLPLDRRLTLCRNPPRLQARRQIGASGCRRQRAGISGPVGRARGADEGEVNGFRV